jgi:hypothetical protein
MTFYLLYIFLLSNSCFTWLVYVLWWCNLQCLPEVIIPVFELFWNHVAPSLQIIHLLRFRVFTCSDKCTVMLARWVCGWTNYCWHSAQLVIYLSIISVRRNIPLYPCCRPSPFQNLNQQTAAVESSTCDSSSPVHLCDVLWLHWKGLTHTWEEASPPISLPFLHRIRNVANYGLADQVPLPCNIAQLKIAKAFWLLTQAGIKTGIQD